jgi:peptide-methionine (S)-S-oxide reductase
MRAFIITIIFLCCNVLISSCQNNKTTSKDQYILKEMMNQTPKEQMSPQSTDTAIFAAGCFWCVEGQFKLLEGIEKVQSGYIGGTVAHPTYEEVCKGTTGHAEAVQVIYDPNKISYDQLLAAFFLAHDPTQLNRQGNDIGTQYRSAIFPLNESQKEKAEFYINMLKEEKVYDKAIVTKIEPIAPFYESEEYHNNYFERNPQNTYCQLVVKPKIEKFRTVFKDYLK